MKNFEFSIDTVCLITDRLTRNYITNVDIAEGFLVCGKESAYFTDARYFSAAKEKLEKVGIKAILYTGLDVVFEFIKDSGATKLLVDYSTVTVKEYNTYLSFGIPLDDLSPYLINMRALKSEKEIALIKKACEIAQQAYYHGISSVKKGMTEQQLKRIIEQKMLELGAVGASFDIIVAFGKNGAVPHHETGDTVLEDDMSILIDMGANVNGYLSDLTRTAFFGEPDKKFLDCYDAVLKANVLAEEKITSGMKCVDADAVAREYLTCRGYGEYFTHSLGHGVGLEIHEYPTLSKRFDTELKDKMVFTVEPGVYFDGEFGIRVEDTVLLDGGKITRLFSDDKSLLIIKN